MPAEKPLPIDTSTCLMDVPLTGGSPFDHPSTLMADGDYRLKRTLAGATPLATGYKPARILCR